MIDKLTEGKTKAILQDPSNSELVIIQSKDDVTAEDGKRRIQLKDKGRFATATTCNIFEFLKTKGVPMAYRGRIGDVEFLSEKLDMLPLEFVARRKAVGSYLDRNPDVEKGTVFDPLVIEVFLKDDSLHDPIIVWDEERGGYFLHDSHKPISAASELSSFDPSKYTRWDLRDFRGFESMMKQETGVVFEALESAFAVQNVVLIDFKIEFGTTVEGAIKLGDVIDADSIRAWIGGDPEKGIDKQYFRDNPDLTDDHLRTLYAKYRQAAEITGKFPGVLQG